MIKTQDSSKSPLGIIFEICSIICVAFLVFALLCGTNAVNISSVIGVAIISIAIFIASKHAKKNYFSILLFSVSFVFYVFVIFVIDTPQTNDFAVQIEAARQFIAGNPEAFHTPYFEAWPDFPNYAILEIALLSISDSAVFIQIFQALCMSLTLVCSYKLLLDLCDFRIASFVVLLLFFFPTFVFTIGSTTNQILSACLSIIAILLFCKSRRSNCKTAKMLMLFALCGLLVALARFVRPDAVLVEVAIVASALLVPGKIKLHKTKEIFFRIGSVLVLALTYILVGMLISGLLYSTGIISDKATGDRVVYNKLLSGTDLDSAGRVSSYYIKNTEEKSKAENISYQEAASKVILERMTSPGYVCALEVKKAETLWWDDPFTHCLYDTYPEIEDWIKNIDKACVFFLILMVILAFAQCRTRKITDLRMILYLILLETFCAYFLIEVQPRYMYFAYIVMFILSADGFCFLWDRLHKKDSKKALVFKPVHHDVLFQK